MFLMVTRNFPPDVGGIQVLMGGLSENLLNHGPVKIFADQYLVQSSNSIFCLEAHCLDARLALLELELSHSIRRCKFVRFVERIRSLILLTRLK